MARAMSKPAANPALEPNICPRCHRDKLVHLKSMRPYDSRDWFKCDSCEHIVTRPRDVPPADSARNPEADSRT
jgi:hypothetical protein